MNVEAFLSDLRGQGLDVEAIGHDIRVRGSKSALTPALLDQIRQRKPELLVFLGPPKEAALVKAHQIQVAPEILRRAAAFRRQMDEWVASERWAVPVLALPGAPEPHAGKCVSCGAEIGSAWRCAPCLTAMTLALDASRRGSEQKSAG